MTAVHGLQSLPLNERSESTSSKSTPSLTSMTSYPTGLLDLPPEILFLIFECRCISGDELYGLSLLCRRLHWPAMSTFLARKRVTDLQNIALRNIAWNPDQFISGSAPLDALAGLNACTFISGTKVKTLHCYFQHPHSPYNMFQYASNLHLALRRLATFINKLKTIEVVRVYLISEKHYLHRQADFPSDSHLKEWTISLLKLAELIVTRGCVEMTIQYDGVGSPMQFQFNKDGSGPFLSSRLGRSLARRMGKYTWLGPIVPKNLRSTTLPASFTSTLPITSIRTLCIHSITLLSPSFLPWTKRLLTESPNLTSISFAHLSFGSEVWTTLLPDIAKAVSHKLTEFSILDSCWKLSTEDLLFFLDRLPRLTKLVIDRALQIWVSEEADEVVGEQTPRPTLNYLESLQAPDNLIYHLLEPPHKRFWDRSSRKNPYTPLPSLRRVTVYPSSLLVGTTAYNVCAEQWIPLMSAVNQHDRGAGPVTFSLDLQADFADQGKYLSIASYLEYRKIVLQDGAIPPPCFQGISEVVMYRFDNMDGYPNDKPLLLCQWLKALFPDLRKVTFTGVTSTLPELMVKMKDETIDELAKSLSEQCPEVEMFCAPNKVLKKLDGVWVESAKTAQ